MHLAVIDRAIIAAYFLVVLSVGVALKRRVRRSDDFLLSGKRIPLWMTGISFMAANLGSLEIMGMVANGAKYGMMTNHFYWIGAIPAMVFLSLFMVRFYYQNNVRSVPEYLRRRFDGRAHALNALSFAIMTILMSGINMFALAIVVRAMLGWSLNASILVSAGVVMVYTLMGGLMSSIYNEVLQFFLIVAGLLPLSYLAYRAAGGYSGLAARLPVRLMHTWAGTGTSSNPFGTHWLAIVCGLGFTMSFGYWCTDFLLVQRAMAARSLNAARCTPLIAAWPKMLFPVLVTLPGLCAAALFGPQLAGNYNEALPLLMRHFYGPGLLGLGLTALIASFMSGMAGNVTAFNTVWTYDLYQTYLRPNQADSHYLKMARAATVVGTALSVGTAYIVLRFDNLMDYMQLVASFFIAPFFATFFLGMFWRRCNATGAFYGMIAGVSASILHYLAVRSGLVHYSGDMAPNFLGAIYGWIADALVTIAVTYLGPPPKPEQLIGLAYSRAGRNREDPSRVPKGVVALAIAILVATCALNVAFW